MTIYTFIVTIVSSKNHNNNSKIVYKSKAVIMIETVLLIGSLFLIVLLTYNVATTEQKTIVNMYMIIVIASEITMLEPLFCTFI